jgi:hypothetical protein
MPMPTSLAPGYVRVTYSGVLFPHHITIPVKYDGTPVPGTEPNVLTKSTDSVAVHSALANLLAPMLTFFHTTTNFGLAEAHTVDPTTGEDQFIYAWNVGLSGSSASAIIPASETVFTFKSNLGTLYRLYLMEGVSAPNQKITPPLPGASGTLADFVAGDDSIYSGLFPKSRRPMTAYENNRVSPSILS